MPERNLTKKQSEYVSCLASGYTIEQIANEKKVSKHTVRNTITAAKKRLGCENTNSLIAEVVDEKLIVKNGKGFIPA